MSMWKWGREIQVVFGILTTVFIAVGLYLMEEIPKMGLSFIVLGAVSFVLLVVSLVKSRKRYGVAELASDMETLSDDLADFVGERGRSDPTNRIKMPKPNWDDERKHEEWEMQTQELIEYGSDTIRIYRRRFASKVAYLVEEAGKLGYQEKEIDSLYKHPTNRLGIEMLSDRMGALSLRMKKEIE
jgi:hypothetical protein